MFLHHCSYGRKHLQDEQKLVFLRKPSQSHGEDKDSSLRIEPQHFGECVSQFRSDFTKQRTECIQYK